MLKKIIAGAAGAGLVLTMAGAAFANGWRHHDDELKIENKDTTVTNNVLTVANTGLNSTGGRRGGGPSSLGGGGWGHHGGGDIDTGDAWALASVSNDVNYNEVGGCGCFDDVKIENKNTRVRNNVTTVANTGLNRTSGGGDIDTGNAGAESYVVNFVNTNIVGGGV